MAERMRVLGAATPLQGNESRLTFATLIVETGDVLAALVRGDGPNDRLEMLHDGDDFTHLDVDLDAGFGEGAWLAGPRFIAGIEEFADALGTGALSGFGDWSVVDDNWYVATGTRAAFVALNEALARAVIGLFWRIVDSRPSGEGHSLRALMAIYEGLFLSNDLTRQVNRAHFATALTDHVAYQIISRAAVARGLVEDIAAFERLVDEEWRRHRQMIARAVSHRVAASSAIADDGAISLLDNRIRESQLVSRTARMVIDELATNDSSLTSSNSTELSDTQEYSNVRPFARKAAS